MTTVYDFSFLDDYSGRIWVIDSEYPDLYNNVLPKDNLKVVKDFKRIDCSYHEYIYNIILLEK